MSSNNDEPDFLGVKKPVEVWTAKKEAFSLAFVETRNASEAYRTAYDAENMQPNVIWKEASLLKSSRMVSERIEILEEEARQRNVVTVDSLTSILREAIDLAKEEGQPSAITSAALGIAKLHGLASDKAHVLHTGDINHNIQVEFVESDSGNSPDTE